MADYSFDNLDLGLMEEQTELESEAIDIFKFNDVIDKASSQIKNPNVLKEYIYMDENSKPAFKIQEQSSGEPFVVMGCKNGVFTYGMNGVKKIPYNVPDLITATNRVIFIVNGEDKADFLKNLGFIATTAPFSGSTKWKEDFNKYLQVAGKALIVADNSQNGQIFAENTLRTVAKALQNNAGIINLKKLASKFNIELEDNSSLMRFRSKLSDDSLIKGAFDAIEKAMLMNI